MIFISKLFQFYRDSFIGGWNLIYRRMMRVMVFNVAFNNISVISWWSVLLAEVNLSIRRKPQIDANYLQTLPHNIVSSTPRHERIRTHVSGDRHWLHPTTIRSWRPQCPEKTTDLPQITDKGSWPSILCIHLNTRLGLQRQ